MVDNSITTSQPHYTGHRQRLRRRLLDSAPQTLPEYEILEILLFAGNARHDVKPLAKELIRHYGSLAQVLHASEATLTAIKGMNETQIAHLCAVREAALHMLKLSSAKSVVMNHHQALIEYCRASMGHLKTEQFRVLYVDGNYHILADELQKAGTVDQVQIYPREIVRRALELHAQAIILVHNHPSGDTTASQADIEVTLQLEQACGLFSIAMIDHLIISATSHFSFYSHGLLSPKS